MAPLSFYVGRSQTNQVTTVFEIAQGSNGIRANALLRLAIGVLFLVAGVAGLIRRRGTQGGFSKKLGPGFMIGWAVLWLTMHIPLLRIATTDLNQLLDIFRNGKSQIAEGFVHVLHEQPAHGHSSGDKITVGGQPFEVNYFLVTPGYRQTIAHDGVLREGVFARLHYYSGVILKVEIGNPKTGQQDGAANGSQPMRSVTNTTPSAAGSRR